MHIVQSARTLDLLPLYGTFLAEFPREVSQTWFYERFFLPRGSLQGPVPGSSLGVQRSADRLQPARLRLGFGFGFGLAGFLGPRLDFGLDFGWLSV